MSRPNILFILIDDLGWRDLACCGSAFYETPVLDRLAAQGLRFTQAYASAPVCSPTRAAFLSGKSPARVGVTQFIGGHAVGRLCDVPYHWRLPTSEVSLASALRAGGYRTWHVGKWHLGDGPSLPERHGFEVNIGGCGWGAPRHGYWSPWRLPGLAESPDGTHLTDRLTDEAVALIRAHDGAAPFFLNLWHYAVHTPIQAPVHLVEKYRRKAAALGLDRLPAIETGEHFPCQHKRGERVERRVIQSDPAYAAMIEHLDTSIGRVLAALDERGFADDTLVVFTSDNGGLATAEGSPTCNLPLAEGKGWMYEGGTRVAQIARWPGQVAAGAVSSEPMVTHDWYPTLLSAAGLPAMPWQHQDGVDLLPLLRGGTPRRPPICWHYPHYSNQGGTPACAIRSGDWKLIEFFEDGRQELYDLHHDPGEEQDLVVAHPDIAAALAARLRGWRAEVEALIPRPNPAWREEPLPADCDGPAV